MNMPDNEQLISDVWTSLAPVAGAGVAVSWEHAFLLAEDSYILMFANLLWLSSPVMHKFFEEVVNLIGIDT